MAYEPSTWVDNETEITAERLNALEQGVAAAEGIEGPRGPKGSKGDKGDPGDDGADGFPTEAQWNDIVSRVEALEAAAE